MSARNDLLDHAMGLFPSPTGALERVIERHRRRQRNRRIAAGVVGIAIALVILAALGTKGILTNRKPARKPSITPSEIFPGFRQTPHEVDVIGLDGSTIQTFSGLPPDAFSPVLSPDGNTLAFISDDVAKEPRLATTGADGSGLRILTSTLLAMNPVWSPDGSRIAFIGTRPAPWNKDVYVIDADGTDLRRITRGPSQDWNPEWSPDGKQLVFVRHPASDAEFANSVDVWVVPVAGGTPTRLTNDPGWNGDPTWAPDGGRIAYVGGHDGSTRILIMDADGSHKHAIVPRPAPYYAPQWSPDGSMIAVFVFRDFNSNTIVNGSPMQAVAVGSIELVDIATGRMTSLGVRVSSSAQRARWLPSGEGLLVDRLVGS
jgi:Tol biopolymer transport system component